MPSPGVSKIPDLRNNFSLTLLLGLASGLLLTLPAALLIGPEAFSAPFLIAGLLIGLIFFLVMSLLVNLGLKRQLRHHLALLRPLTGEMAVADDTLGGMNRALTASLAHIDALVRQLRTATDQCAPHCRALTEVSHFLSERAREGLEAANRACRDMESMETKQREVMAQVQSLTEKAQDEAAWSRELSASLADMTRAMEQSTARFLETTATVDQMAANIREVVTQAEEVTRSVESTAQDLDTIGDSLTKVQAGAVASAHSANTVKDDAENGLRVVRVSMDEMARIEAESLKATEAMQRLSQQTKEAAKIIEVIKELVSDTELLAFNAAIIAAKAGEEGKGFSVVAEEIRDLADRTTGSAQDIQEIVKAIGGDTQEVTAAVNATARAIARGKELSQSTGEALRKIVDSSSGAAASSDEIAALTEQQGRRARALLDDAGRSLQSVKAITRIVREQQLIIAHTQEGVSQMKAATDRISQGMAEQVKANRQFDQGLAERETQVQAINEATHHQMTTTGNIRQHFVRSEQRLQKNAEKAVIIGKETAALETVARQLKELVATFSSDPGDRS